MTELESLQNPFRDNVVQDAWQSPIDVSEIHHDVFDQCLAGIESATRGVSDSLIIYGPAGSGKTHLLTRLQRHLAETRGHAPDQELRCVFVFVRLQSSPLLLWQHVRRRLVSDLMRQDQGMTQLQRLLAHQLGQRSGASPRRGIFRMRVLGSLDREDLSRHVLELTASLSLPRELCLVLERLSHDEYIRDASAWLAGESLPDDVLGRLGLGPELVEDREDASRELVTALCRLAGETLPIVFCFDQVEALQRSSDDRDAFFRFGRMAADLHDADPNIFLITCVQSALFTELERAVRQADFERIAKRRAYLTPLDRSQVEKLVCTRLELVPELQSLRERRIHERLTADRYFPLSKQFLDKLSAEPSVVPRRVLASCAREFEERQHGKTLHRPSQREFLGQELAERQAAALNASGTAETTRIFLQGLQVLTALTGNPVRDRDAAGADLVVEGPRPVAISLRNEADGRSLGPKLRALLAHSPRLDGARLAIVRDPRLPISKNAVKTRQYLEDLQSRGAILVQPTLEALAALDALSSILADAKSGDLANDGEALGESEVLTWLRGLHKTLSVEPIEELINAVTSDEAPAPARSELQDLAAWLAREHVAELDAASTQLGCERGLLLELARRGSDRFLVLEGPPILLLDVAGVPLDVEA